ncbi:hypothetical protein WJX84_005915 [Apatococcus fuscideae]|uniref:RWD domain-containing protein n=1 Tax=Apatococcus fuscideae TaxID=2026836 RepID=A0AAW1TD66_9CHLO
MSAGREAQLEELVGLEAVFGKDVKIDTTSYSCFAYLPSLTASPHVTLKINLPESYPEHSAPELEVLAAHLRQSTRARLAEQLKARFSPGSGPVIYDWLEWLKEENLLDELVPQPAQLSADANQQEAQEQVAAGVAAEQAAATARDFLSHLDDVSSQIVHGEPITEKRSTFQAHLAAVKSMEEVQEVMEALLQNNKIQNATHNIMAFRIRLPLSDTYLQDCDDDGESAAGARLLHLLQIMDACNVVIIVSRCCVTANPGPEGKSGDGLAQPISRSLVVCWTK